jgi:hypothetical protein
MLHTHRASAALSALLCSFVASGNMARSSGLAVKRRAVEISHLPIGGWAGVGLMSGDLRPSRGVI